MIPPFIFIHIKTKQRAAPIGGGSLSYWKRCGMGLGVGGRFGNVLLAHVDADEHDDNGQSSQDGQYSQRRTIGAGQVVQEADGRAADGAASHGEGRDEAVQLAVVFGAEGAGGHNRDSDCSGAGTKSVHHSSEVQHHRAALNKEEADQEQQEGSGTKQDADLGAEAVEDAAQHQLADDSNNRVERNVGSDEAASKPTLCR